MPSILDYLNTISDARYGRDVRQAIVDAISTCYEDGKAGVNDLEARRLIESAIAVNEDQQADIDTLYAEIAEIQGGGGESSQESTSITLDTIIFDGGFVDSVSVANNSTATYDVTFEKEFTEIPEVFACVAVQTSAGSAYSKVTVGIVKSQTTTTGFRFFIANTSGASRSVTVVWAAFQPTTKEIDLDITIPSGDGMSEADVLAITNPIQTALNGVKTGYDGTEYSTPGEAVRTQINDLHVLIGDEPGTAIDASAIGYGEDSNVEDALNDVNERLDNLGGGIPSEVRQALLTLLGAAAYTETGLADELAVIQSWASQVTAITLNKSTTSISGSNTDTLVATTTPAGSTVVWTSSDPTIASVNSSGVVTGVNNGSCTITATSGDRSASCAVTVSGFATLTGISAVYSGGSVQEGATLSDLVSDLVVTASYSDSSTATLTDSDYALSGSLAVGANTVTVSYGGKTTTFSVTVISVVTGWLYRFDGNLNSDGTNDFGFQWRDTTAQETYSTGHDGTGQCYLHEVGTEGTGATEVNSIYANNFTPPDWSGDFTWGIWFKSEYDRYGQIYCPFTVSSINASATAFEDVANVATGWSVAKAGTTKQVQGCRFWWTAVGGAQKLQIHLTDQNANNGSNYNITPPSSFDSTQWHHYALTRKDGTIRFFIDGNVIFTLEDTHNIRHANQVTLGGYFNAAGDTTPSVQGRQCYFDDLFVAEYCKWDSAFDPSVITY